MKLPRLAHGPLPPPSRSSLSLLDRQASEQNHGLQDLGNFLALLCLRLHTQEARSERTTLSAPLGDAFNAAWHLVNAQ